MVPACSGLYTISCCTLTCGIYHLCLIWLTHWSWGNGSEHLGCHLYLTILSLIPWRIPSTYSFSCCYLKCSTEHVLGLFSFCEAITWPWDFLWPFRNNVLVLWWIYKDFNRHTISHNSWWIMYYNIGSSGNLNPKPLYDGVLLVVECIFMPYRQAFTQMSKDEKH